jgi:hypothetical protein
MKGDYGHTEYQSNFWFCGFKYSLTAKENYTELTDKPNAAQDLCKQPLNFLMRSTTPYNMT